ncbi:stabilin-2-like [Mya arenaria]|uniref:stabilin-2-like n=1 Tax=Mya arenaria TaxID=6604 RepID=UPI0022E36117|nr:stabilin-2-like [Mya arenaria]
MGRPFVTIVVVLVASMTSMVDAAVLDGSCDATDVCTVANSECSTICICASGYTKQGAACKADIGTACSATTDCDTVTNAATICDTTATTSVCKVALPQETCVTNADCTAPNNECKTTKCVCVTGYTQEGTTCKAVIGTACSATTDCDTVTNVATICDTTATPSVCKVGDGGICTGNQCVENAACDTTCSCNTDYNANSEKLCMKDGASGVTASLIILVASFLTTLM